MPSNSKKTKGADLGGILEGLINADIQFILVGGLAAVIQGAPEPLSLVAFIRCLSCIY